MHHRPRGTQVQPERIAIAQPRGGDLLLPIFQRLHRSSRITQMRGLFEPLGRGRVLHGIAQAPDQLVVLALEEQLRALHGFVVPLSAADRRHAGRDAPLDVVLEARTLAHAGNHFVARSNPEQPMREPHRPARQRGGHERPGVKGAVALHMARDEHARERLVGGELEVRIILVVAKQDVIFGPALLDQMIFERQRLDDRVGDDDLEAIRLIQQGIGFRMYAACAEITPHAIAQRARLADINGLARLIRVYIHPGLLRQMRDLALEILDGHKLLWRALWSLVEPFIIAHR